MQAGDEDLKNVKFEEIRGRYLVLEEKVDGANCGISFGADGRMYLQSRGHFLNGGYGERQFDLFKVWAGCHKDRLYEILGDRYVMYGEWLYAKHTVFYDRLPHYFMEFDILDKMEKRFLSTGKRQEILKNAPFVKSVRILKEGCQDSVEGIAGQVGPSLFISEDPKERLTCFREQCKKGGVDADRALGQTDMTGVMEGIYIKVEDGDYVTDRLKYVRRSFLNVILDSESHWASRPVIANRLAEGVDLFL